MRRATAGWCITACVVIALTGCGDNAPRQGADGMDPTEVATAALTAANRGHYLVASKYFTPERRRALEAKYEHEGGIAQYWDYMTSACSAERFEPDRWRTDEDGSAIVWVQKVRVSGEVGPPAHFRLIMVNGVWRINGH